MNPLSLYIHSRTKKNEKHGAINPEEMGVAKVKRGHVLAVPFPAQGHVTPLMKLSHLIASHGIKVTFVNTEFIHNKISLPHHHHHHPIPNLLLTSISDGLAADDDRADGFKLWESLKTTMAGNLADLVEKMNSSSCDEKVGCIIADITLGWILEIAESLGAEAVGFTPASAASLAMALHIPNLIQQGNLDLHGSLKGSEIIRLSDDIPPWRRDEFAWSFPNDVKTQKIMLECCLYGEKAAKSLSNWLLCNTFYELETSACDLNPKLLPVGPLLKNIITSFSSFHVEDTSCLTWLDQKPCGSVIYISFGSIAVFSQHQLDELALGLESSGRPFLWVVRSDLTGNGSRFEYPNGFLERVSNGGLGKIVGWAPQEKVLSHSSIGCFLSHCGWNSTLEGLSAGVPFLCWPYFADQYHNQSYICEKWRIGLRIEHDGDGIRERLEIKKKIEMLFDDDVVRGNALRLKLKAEKSVAQDGSTFMSFQRFIDHFMKK